MNKMYRIFLSCFLLFSFLSLKAQQPVWNFQKRDSLFGAAFFKLSSDTTTWLIKSKEGKTKADYTKLYNDRLTQIKEVLTTTRLVSDPAVVNYVQQVVQKIIAGNNDLKTVNPRVVLTRDWWPNAYCMGEGTIVVNAGLFIYLNTEAEFAFVLAHELAHLRLNHSGQAIEHYVETINSEWFQSELKRLYKEQYNVNKQLEQLVKPVVFNSRRHSRDKETQADQYAYQYVLNSGFYTGAVESVLKTLDRVDDTSAFRPIQVDQMLNFANYPFKQKWIQKETSIFSEMKEDTTVAEKQDLDSMKTHPDCLKRIELFHKLNPVLKGSDFLVNETMFQQLHTNFLVEIAEECYNGGNLSRNLYYSLQMIHENRFLPYAVYSVARCLNRMYEEQKNHHLGLYIDVENKLYNKDYNLLLRMIGRIRLNELALLNLHFCGAYAEQMKTYDAFEKEYNIAKQRTF